MPSGQNPSAPSAAEARLLLARLRAVGNGTRLPM